jgi:SHS2 domain-containing protein
MPADHEWAEHTGELELHVRADDEAGVFGEGLRALGELLGDGERGPLERFEVTAEGDGRAALFAAWLEELSYRAEADGLVPVDVERLALEPARVDATARGYRGEPPHLVKAVTYHRLAFDRCDSGWCAVAVLDV